jgi:hypothetical protein
MGPMSNKVTDDTCNSLLQKTCQSATAFPLEKRVQAGGYTNKQPKFAHRCSKIYCASTIGLETIGGSRCPRTCTSTKGNIMELRSEEFLTEGPL